MGSLNCKFVLPLSMKYTQNMVSLFGFTQTMVELCRGHDLSPHLLPFWGYVPFTLTYTQRRACTGLWSRHQSPAGDTNKRNVVPLEQDPNPHFLPL